MYSRTNKVKNGAEELFALCKESFAGKVRDLRQEFFCSSTSRNIA